MRRQKLLLRLLLRPALRPALALGQPDVRSAWWRCTVGVSRRCDLRVRSGVEADSSLLGDAVAAVDDDELSGDV